MSEEKTYKINVDCPLSNDDRIKFGNISHEATDRIEEIESELKSLKAEKTMLEKSRSGAARIAKQGFETRPIECRAEFNTPETGKVSYFSLDPIYNLPVNEPVLITEMTQEQMTL
jgi:hypothetical protein